ncbi:MAG: flavin reductase family protein [Candidatus Bipolaricaulota bacterium]|nr:flavin reductase family protein [Candidatus Bipolaricaulota bacterium]
MKQVHPWERFAEVQEQVLHGGGAFLVAADASGKPNAMTIGWFQLGTVWSRPVAHVLVRPSRYTHGLLRETGEFVVAVPFGTMAEELAFCGSQSGRDLDKFRELGLRTAPGTAVRVPLLLDCSVAYECRVVARAELRPEGILDDGIQARYYARGDLHTLFLGEVLAAWDLTK